MAGFKPILRIFLLLILAAHTGPSHAAILPANGLLDFSVIRNGEKIGTHVLSFRQANNRIDVDIQTRIAVKIAFITVYRFEHDGHEKWKDGKLVRMETKTNDDGTDHTLQVSADGAHKLHVVSDGRESEIAPDMVPASLWNPAFIRTHELMDSLVGTPLNIKIADKGEETVDVRGKPVQAHHYSMTGDLARELWYDDKGILVRMALTGKDGTNVDYVLR